MRGGGGRRGGQARAATGAAGDVESSLRIPFLTAVTGGESRSSSPAPTARPRRSTVKIPPGIDDGAKIRLRGKGEPGLGGGPAGSLVITVQVEPHPYFRREGANLLVDLPITVGEAVLGARVDVPDARRPEDPDRSRRGAPAARSSGSRARACRPTGDQPAGDLFAVLKVVVPKAVDDESRRLIEQFAERNPTDPRRGLW